MPRRERTYRPENCNSAEVLRLLYDNQYLENPDHTRRILRDEKIYIHQFPESAIRNATQKKLGNFEEKTAIVISPILAVCSFLSILIIVVFSPSLLLALGLIALTIVASIFVPIIVIKACVALKNLSLNRQVTALSTEADAIQDLVQFQQNLPHNPVEVEYASAQVHDARHPATETTPLLLQSHFR